VNCGHGVCARQGGKTEALHKRKEADSVRLSTSGSRRNRALDPPAPTLRSSSSRPGKRVFALREHRGTEDRHQLSRRTLASSYGDIRFPLPIPCIRAYAAKPEKRWPPIIFKCNLIYSRSEGASRYKTRTYVESGRTFVVLGKLLYERSVTALDFPIQHTRLARLLRAGVISRDPDFAGG
jgi:hypothetical protein